MHVFLEVTVNVDRIDAGSLIRDLSGNWIGGFAANLAI